MQFDIFVIHKRAPFIVQKNYKKNANYINDYFLQNTLVYVFVKKPTRRF